MERDFKILEDLPIYIYNERHLTILSGRRNFLAVGLFLEFYIRGSSRTFQMT